MTEPAGLFTPEHLTVGQRVTVTQQVQHKGWTASVTGQIEAFEQRKTGSWFAHAKDDRLWLDRLVLKKDDGEIVVCNLDRYSRVEPTPPTPGSSPEDSGDASAGDLMEGDRSAGASDAGPGSHPSGASVHGIAEGALPERSDADG